MGDGRAVRRAPHPSWSGMIVMCAIGYLTGRHMGTRTPPVEHGQAPKVMVADAQHQKQSMLEGMVQNLVENQPLSNSKDGQQGLEHGKDGQDMLDDIPFQVLTWEPRAVHYPGFVSKEVCEKIMSLAAPRLTPSRLALRKGDTHQGTANIRTSQGTFLSRRDDKDGWLLWLEKRIARVTMIPHTHGEPFNILRYQLGQKYDSHYDTFDPESYGAQPSQRLATFLLYLTDVEQGGETIFPFEGMNGMTNQEGFDFKTCDRGLKVKPKAGDGLLFYSLHANGTFDKISNKVYWVGFLTQHALHGGCPVIEGDKWVATKWIRDKQFGVL